MKRVISAILGLPIVIAFLVLGNTYVVDIGFMFIAMICMYEYCNAISKVAKPVKMVGYLSCISIGFLHIIPPELVVKFYILVISLIFLLLFLKVIITDMATNVKDIVFTFFGITYVVFFSIFIAIINGMENGKYLIWYIIISAWGTDIFAYLIGKHFGKHYFSKVSPKKTIEGCIGGTIGAIVISMIYTLIINKYMGMNFSYVYIMIITIILSIIGQIGDFSASSIKRYVDVKDYGNLIPGHGGMLDRIDSLLFLAPFAYICLSIIY